MTNLPAATRIWNARKALDFALSDARDVAINRPNGSPVLNGLALAIVPMAKAFDAYVAELLAVASSETDWDTHATYGARRVSDDLMIEAAKADAEEAERAANPAVWSASREEFV